MTISSVSCENLSGTFQKEGQSSIIAEVGRIFSYDLKMLFIDFKESLLGEIDGIQGYFVYHNFYVINKNLSPCFIPANF